MAIHLHLRRGMRAAAACLALGAAGCAQLSSHSTMQPAAQLDATRLAQIDTAIEAALTQRKMPGAVYRIERLGANYEKAYGRLSYEEGVGAVSADSVFDAASLTKVVATAPSVLLLAQEGKIALDAALSTYFPECAVNGKEGITVRHLLTHTSGLPSGLPSKPAWLGDAAAHELACAQVPTHAPGTFFRYSDVNFVLLGQLVQRVAGMPLNQFAHERIFAPLRMNDTGFLPLGRMAAERIAPTNPLLRGLVHDPTARRMDGVAGSAGLFTTARDLARYARMLLAGGELDGVRVMSPDSVRLLTTVQSPPGITELRAMGMDINSPYARPRGTVFPVGSYGHTGFTGCILWIDPTSKTFYVFLSNRVYPDDKSNILDLYGALGTLSAQAAK